MLETEESLMEMALGEIPPEDTEVAPFKYEYEPVGPLGEQQDARNDEVAEKEADPEKTAVAENAGGRPESWERVDAREGMWLTDGERIFNPETGDSYAGGPEANDAAAMEQEALRQFEEGRAYVLLPTSEERTEHGVTLHVVMLVLGREREDGLREVGWVWYRNELSLEEEEESIPEESRDIVVEHAGWGDPDMETEAYESHPAPEPDAIAAEADAYETRADEADTDIDVREPLEAEADDAGRSRETGYAASDPEEKSIAPDAWLTELLSSSPPGAESRLEARATPPAALHIERDEERGARNLASKPEVTARKEGPAEAPKFQDEKREASARAPESASPLPARVEKLSATGQPKARESAADAETRDAATNISEPREGSDRSTEHAILHDNRAHPDVREPGFGVSREAPARDVENATARNALLHSGEPAERGDALKHALSESGHAEIGRADALESHASVAQTGAATKETGSAGADRAHVAPIRAVFEGAHVDATPRAVLEAGRDDDLAKSQSREGAPRGIAETPLERARDPETLLRAVGASDVVLRFVRNPETLPSGVARVPGARQGFTPQRARGARAGASGRADLIMQRAA